MLKDYTKSCRPILISSEDSDMGSRIGGNPPEGIRPKEIFDCTRYFATLVIDESTGREISIFNSFERDVISDRSFHYSGRSFLREKNKIFEANQSSLIQFVVHEKSKRALGCVAIASELTPKSLVLKPELPDAEGWLDSEIYQGSKMGGWPYYWQNKKSITDQGNALLKKGFVHLFQFAFPDHRDALISGDWPYGPYIMHVFVDDPKDPQDIRVGWG